MPKMYISKKKLRLINCHKNYDIWHKQKSYNNLKLNPSQSNKHLSFYNSEFSDIYFMCQTESNSNSEADYNHITLQTQTLDHRLQRCLWKLLQISWKLKRVMTLTSLFTKSSPYINQTVVAVSRYCLVYFFICTWHNNSIKTDNRCKRHVERKMLKIGCKCCWISKISEQQG